MTAPLLLPALAVSSARDVVHQSDAPAPTREGR